ncbi:MAG: hypothetical protein IJ109_07245 [Firmicutes bacterium]|nr:hypothetical protein [Bacillota bacterium]
MDYIIQEIDLLLQILLSRRAICSKRLSLSPPGGLNRVMVRKRPVYSHAVPRGRYSGGSIRYQRTEISEDDPLLRELALKEYLRITLRILDNNIRVLECAKAGLKSLEFSTVRSQMRRPYQALDKELLSLAFLDGSSLSAQHAWAARPFEQSTYRPEEKIHITSRGLAMRSRAELLIAEMLYRFDIPFRYEQVIRAGRYELAPDFTFLDADGNEFYWEYCGMMSVPGYRDHQLWRRKMYESIDICEWTNMICTYDASDGIDMREIEAIIRTKILPRMQG